jgi:hypothetical protein
VSVACILHLSCNWWWWRRYPLQRRKAASSISTLRALIPVTVCRGRKSGVDISYLQARMISLLTGELSSVPSALTPRLIARDINGYTKSDNSIQPLRKYLGHTAIINVSGCQSPMPEESLTTRTSIGMRTMIICLARSATTNSCFCK